MSKSPKKLTFECDGAFKCFLGIIKVCLLPKYPLKKTVIIHQILITKCLFFKMVANMYLTQAIHYIMTFINNKIFIKVN